MIIRINLIGERCSLSKHYMCINFANVLVPKPPFLTHSFLVSKVDIDHVY